MEYLCPAGTADVQVRRNTGGSEKRPLLGRAGKRPAAGPQALENIPIPAAAPRRHIQLC